MTKFKRMIALLLGGAMCAVLAFGAACNSGSGEDSDPDANIENPDENPDETPETPAETQTETVYTVSESEWGEALSYKNVLNCTVSLYVTDGIWGSQYTAYTGLSEAEGIITGKVCWSGDYFVTTDGVDEVYYSVDAYEYHTGEYLLHGDYYKSDDSGEGANYTCDGSTEGYYERLTEIVNEDTPFFLFLVEDLKDMYFNYSNFEYDETTNKYVYTASGGSVTVIFENGYVTYVKLVLDGEAQTEDAEAYFEWTYSDYGTTDVENYFTSDFLDDIYANVNIAA